MTLSEDFDEEGNYTPKNTMEKVKGFVVALAEWRKAGSPVRSPEWIEELWREHCEPCSFYSPTKKNMPGPLGKKGICLHCGCHVSPTDLTLANKLRMPTVGCPIGKFPADVADDTINMTNEEKLADFQKKLDEHRKGG